MLRGKNIIKNDWSQPDPTFKTCDMNHEAESQYKRQTQKITIQNSQPTKIIRDKLEKTNKKKDFKNINLKRKRTKFDTERKQNQIIKDEFEK